MKYTLAFAAMLALQLSVSACTRTLTPQQQWAFASYPAHIQDALRRSVLLIGMTQEQVRMSWGEPGNVSTYIGAHTRQTWQYSACGRG